MTNYQKFQMAMPTFMHCKMIYALKNLKWLRKGICRAKICSKFKSEKLHFNLEFHCKKPNVIERLMTFMLTHIFFIIIGV